MRKILSVSLFTLLLLVFAGAAFANPSVIVNDPADMRFVELTDLARFLEEDLDLGKGITEVIGKKVIDKRFRKAGMPDPSKEVVSYCMVAREMPVDMLNVAFILKGNIDTQKFLEFADKRYYRYFGSLHKQGIEAKAKIPVNATINGKMTRVYPFAFRKSEALITSFADYTIIATIPRGNPALIVEIIDVLEGKKAKSAKQPEKISYLASFVPSEQEREEIKKFQGQYEGFLAKARSGFKKVTNKKAYAGEKRMTGLENSLKAAMSEIKRLTYSAEASEKNDGYAYNIDMIFKCADARKAENLKNLLLAWLASSSAKALSDQDMVSLKANKVAAHRENCIFSIKLGSSAAEQYQFSSLIMTLMMQDRRFNRILSSRN